LVDRRRAALRRDQPREQIGERRQLVGVGRPLIVEEELAAGGLHRDHHWLSIWRFMKMAPSLTIFSPGVRPSITRTGPSISGPIATRRARKVFPSVATMTSQRSPSDSAALAGTRITGWRLDPLTSTRANISGLSR